MRILHVIGDLAPESGGPAKACVEMARALARRGHEVSVATTDFSPSRGRAAPEIAPEPGLTLHVFPLSFPRRWLASWRMRDALPELIGEAEIVHIHSLYLFHSWAAGTLCRRMGAPYIIRPHGTLDPLIHRRHRWRKRVMELAFQDRLLRDAAAIHYTSAEERRLAEPFVHGAPGIVIPLGLELEDYAALPPPGAFRSRHPEIGERPILLFLGREVFVVLLVGVGIRRTRPIGSGNRRLAFGRLVSRLGEPVVVLRDGRTRLGGLLLGGVGCDGERLRGRRAGTSHDGGERPDAPADED